MDYDCNVFRVASSWSFIQRFLAYLLVQTMGNNDMVIIEAYFALKILT